MNCVINLPDELNEKLLHSKFYNGNVESSIISIISKQLMPQYNVFASSNSDIFIHSFKTKEEAENDFANLLYKHLCANHWITNDKRSITEIIRSGFYKDEDLKLEIKEKEINE